MLPRVQAHIGDHLGTRVQHIRTRQFSQHDASQGLTNAADTEQKIAFPSQDGIIVDCLCDGFVDSSELAGEMQDRHIGQRLSHSVNHAAVLAILPFGQTCDDAGSNRLQLTQPAVGLRRRCPRLRFEQFAILANVRRIDPVSFVTAQLGAREVPNLGGIDDADDMTSLVQCTREAETIPPGRLQTGVNPSDLLSDQPVQEMAPSIRGIREAPRTHLVAARYARVERIFRNIDTQYPVDHCPILSPRLFSKSSASNNLVRRICASARPKIPFNLSSGAWKTGPNLPHGLIRQGTTEAHRSPRSLSKMFICCATCNVQGTIWGASKLGGRNITKYLQPRKSPRMKSFQAG